MLVNKIEKKFNIFLHEALTNEKSGVIMYSRSEQKGGGEKMDKRKLEAVMVLNGDNNASLAMALGIAPQTLSRKKNGTDGADFTQTEITLIKQRYRLSSDEIDSIFFTPCVFQK